MNFVVSTTKISSRLPPASFSKVWLSGYGTGPSHFFRTHLLHNDHDHFDPQRFLVGYWGPVTMEMDLHRCRSPGWASHLKAPFLRVGIKRVTMLAFAAKYVPP